MKIADRLLEIYSITFIAVLCLFFLIVGLIGKLGGGSVQFAMLPWSGNELLNWMISLSLLGLVAAALAAVGRLRGLLALFAVCVFALIVWGFYLGPHRFAGYDDFQQSLLLTLCALAAALGAIPKASRRRR